MDPSVIIPEEFIKVVRDFVSDIRTTFPEYGAILNKYDQQYAFLYDFCKKKMLPRFFDILYKNAEIFAEVATDDTEFLPKIHFKNIWQENISEATRETIWKYLQLILFSLVDTKVDFTDTAKWAEQVNHDEFKQKMEEAMSHIQEMFGESGDEGEGEKSGGEMGEEGGLEEESDGDQLHANLSSMLGGKLGKLAHDIAEETAANLHLGDATDMKDVFQGLMKNPAQLMGMVQTVGSKLDAELKSGNLKESELLSEVTEMMDKMKHIPGMGDIPSMLNKMGMGMGMGMSGGAKVDTAAMEAKLQQKMKMAKTKERMKAKLEAKALAKLQETTATSSAVKAPVCSEEELVKLFEAVDKKKGKKNKQS
jgi:hypothetical protein